MSYLVSKYATKKENDKNQLNHWSEYIRKLIFKNETLFKRNLLQVKKFLHSLQGPIS